MFINVNMYLFCLLYVQETIINIFIDFTTTNSSQSSSHNWLTTRRFFQSFNNIIWQSYHHIININIKQFCNLDLNLFYKKSNHLQRHFINVVYMNSCIVTPKWNMFLHNYTAYINACMQCYGETLWRFRKGIIVWNQTTVSEYCTQGFIPLFLIVLVKG